MSTVKVLDVNCNGISFQMGNLPRLYETLNLPCDAAVTIPDAIDQVWPDHFKTFATPLCRPISLYTVVVMIFPIS